MFEYEIELSTGYMFMVDIEYEPGDPAPWNGDPQDEGDGPELLSVTLTHFMTPDSEVWEEFTEHFELDFNELLDFGISKGEVRAIEDAINDKMYEVDAGSNPYDDGYSDWAYETAKERELWND